MNTPLVTIIDRPYRRSRAEHVLRELMHTSYPHALLGNLSVAVAQRAGYTQAQLDALATERYDAEAEYRLLDFIRCVEIKRHRDSVVVMVKALKVEPTTTTIADEQKNHEYLASTAIALPSVDFALTDPEGLAELILKAFYCAWVRNPVKERPYEESTWMCRTRIPLEPPQANKLYAVTDELQTTTQARALLTESVQKPKFRFVLTPNTILLMGEEKRLWGINKTPKPN